jgi:uncharacterized tellurite resistance protein B-like protein
MDFTDGWTTAHDLALIYCGLASIDRDLTDEEVRAIESRLAEWVPLSADTTTQEVVQDAATAFKQSRKELGTAVRRVDQELSADECRKILRHLLRIAEADGVLLGAERQLIHRLATVWSLRRLPDSASNGATAVPERREDHWTLLHELAFLYIQMGEGSGEGLSADTFRAMGERLREWDPDRSVSEIRETLRQALQAFEDRADDPFIASSVEAVEEALSPVQQLIVLDDLQAVSRADGSATQEQNQRLLSLADAWGMHIRLEEA